MNTQKTLPIGAKLAIPLLFLVIAFNAPMFLRLFLETENTSYLSTTVKLVLLSVMMFWLVPFVIGIPSREDKRDNLRRIGIVSDRVLPYSIVLGVVLGIVSLSFMLAGSAVTGGFALDLSRVDPRHIYFSLVPGIFEEVVFRGFLMVAAIELFKSVKKAAVFQVVIFTLSHLKELSGWGVVDTLTVAVIAIAFTYVVFRTGHLYTAIIFHFIHDAFLFVVQKPDGAQSFMEHLAFYLAVWLGMGAIMLITRSVSGKFYSSGRGSPGRPGLLPSAYSAPLV